VEYSLQGEFLGHLSLPELDNAERLAVAGDGRLFVCAEPNRIYVLEPEINYQ